MRKRTLSVLIFTIFLATVVNLILIFSKNSLLKEAEKSRRTFENYLKLVFNEFDANGNKDYLVEKIEALKDVIVLGRLHFSYL